MTQTPPGPLRIGEICAGYGGLGMGLALASENVETVWIAETDPAVASLWPTTTPNLGDIVTADWSSVERVDLIAAGFPCQPFSAAGAQLAEADPRYLWPAVRVAVAALRPARVLLENVRNLISMRKGEIWRSILDDLGQLGYDVTWLTLGACAVGAAHHRHRVFALATQTGHESDHTQRLDVPECGAKNAVILPTPTTRDGDGRGTGDAGYWDRRQRTGRTNGFPLDATVALLPTPRASDHEFGGRQLGADGRTPSGYGADLIDLAASRLLPTPRASVDPVGGPGQRGSSGDLAMPSAVQPQNWGRFADAVARHAAIYGDPPAPTEPNRNGAPRLAAAFAEWLMCIPAGHVTDRLDRRDALKAIGNGVCPPQVALAWRYLTGQQAPPAQRPLDASLGRALRSSTMTTTNEEIAEIQRRQADDRAAVIDAACKSRDSMNSGHSTSDGEMAHVVEAAMMALVEVWRAEADWWESTTKRGRQGTAKDIRAAATRLAGFAVGLSTRPIGDVPGALQSLPPAAPDGGNGEAASITGSGGLPTPIITEIVAALPDGDPVATQFCDHPAGAMSILKSGNARCTACGEDLPSLDAEPSPPARASDGLFDDIATTEEQNLTAIIGPLGFGNAPATPALVDNPFTSPAANPWRASSRAATMVAFEHLPALAAKTPRRERVSHSFVETYEMCSLRSMLSDASRAGHLSPSRPGWSLVGGNAFHAAIQAVEQAAVVGQDLRPVGDELNAFWQHFLDAQVKTTVEEMGTSAYADPGTWHVANSGKEGYDWWRVEGARMVKLYLDHHDAKFREQVKTLMIGDTTPAIEAPYDMAIRSLDGQQGLPVKGSIDIARMDLSTYVVTINDYKTGAREPKSTFQLGEYAHALLFLMGLPAEPDPITRPIMGSYWLARKGIYTTPIRTIATHPISELAYRYGTALGGHQAGVFSPNVSDFCVACGSRDYCPTQTGR